MSDLVLSHGPFVKDAATTPNIMRDVLIAALLVLGAATFHFGLTALAVTGAATLGAVGTEWWFTRKRPGGATTGDWSAALTGVLLGLTLPPALPLWMAFLGGVAGIGLGKLIFGGLGQNPFNPALVGRAFLQAAFPTAITTWTPPVDGSTWTTIPSSIFAAPLMHGEVDIMTSATPLGLAKFQGEGTALADLFFGTTGGSLGETNALLLIAVGLWLASRRAFDWRLPVSTLLSVAVLSGALHLVLPEAVPTPGFMLLSGGLLLAAVFMVTDPVSTPTTAKGAWIFGLGVGGLVVLIRAWGGLPEGVMYAILLMNAATPHIERYTQPRPFGGG